MSTREAVAAAVRELVGHGAAESEAALARRLGMSPAALSKRLGGSVRFDLNDVEELASELGVDPFDLMEIAADHDDANGTLPDETLSSLDTVGP